MKTLHDVQKHGNSIFELCFLEKEQFAHVRVSLRNIYCASLQKSKGAPNHPIRTLLLLSVTTVLRNGKIIASKLLRKIFFQNIDFKYRTSRFHSGTRAFERSRYNYSKLSNVLENNTQFTELEKIAPTVPQK